MHIRYMAINGRILQSYWGEGKSILIINLFVDLIIALKTIIIQHLENILEELINL